MKYDFEDKPLDHPLAERCLFHMCIKWGPKTHMYEGGSICNENPFITPSTNALESYAICQTEDQSVAVKMVHETLFYLFKFNKLHTV